MKAIPYDTWRCQHCGETITQPSSVLGVSHRCKKGKKMGKTTWLDKESKT